MCLLVAGSLCERRAGRFLSPGDFCCVLAGCKFPCVEVVSVSVRGGGWGVASSARVPGFLLRPGSLLAGGGAAFRGFSSLCAVLARSCSVDL